MKMLLKYIALFAVIACACSKPKPQVAMENACATTSVADYAKNRPNKIVIEKRLL